MFASIIPKSYNHAPKIILNRPHIQFKWLFMFPILPTFELDFHFPMLLLKPHFELLKCNKFKCNVKGVLRKRSLICLMKF